MIESIKMALASIWINKLRSLLTMLGIIIGIASVIIVVAIGSGGESVISSEFENVGMNRVVLTYNYSEDIRSRDKMTKEDIKSIERSFRDKIVGISSVLTIEGSVTTINKKEGISVMLNGVNSNYLDIQKLSMTKGRFLIDSDVAARRNVAVVEESFAEEVFGHLNVIGEKTIIKSNNQSIPIVIVGIYKPQESMMANLVNAEQPKKLYLPLSTIEKISGNGGEVNTIDINLTDNKEVQTTIDNMIHLIERRHKNIGDKKYQGYSAEGQLKMITKVTGIFTLVISAIAAISLLVGGIGVMNIMLVSVTERTREIGIRKALGAKYVDIMKQFLIESVIISFLGGVIGTLVGIGISGIIATLINIPALPDIRTILVAWGFATIVGVFFGLYPASKAAKLDPIDALRYE